MSSTEILNLQRRVRALEAQLPDQVDLKNYQPGVLYGAAWFPQRSCVPVDAWSASRSQVIPGGTRYATAAHTNLPRSGDCGLPMDWGMHVQRVSALISPLTEDTIEWAGNRVVVQMEYNGRRELEAPLAELVLGGQAVKFTMTPNLMYRATIVPQVGETPYPGVMVWIRLEGWLKKALY